jgi:hypothetical protein
MRVATADELLVTADTGAQTVLQPGNNEEDVAKMPDERLGRLYRYSLQTG